MRYREPAQVTSPQDLVEIIEIVHDGGEESFSIARVLWNKVPRFGIRWNVGHREWDVPEKQSKKMECLGVPTSSGHPVWFILPDELLDRENGIWKALEQSSLKEGNL